MADQQPDDKLIGPEKQAAPPPKEAAKKTPEQQNRAKVIAVYEKLQGKASPEKIMGAMAKEELEGEKKQPSLKDWLVQGAETRRQINALSAKGDKTNADKQQLEDLKAQENRISKIEGHANSRVVADILGPQLQLQSNPDASKNFESFKQYLNSYTEAAINNNEQSRQGLRGTIEKQYNGIFPNSTLKFETFLHKFETQIDLPIEPDDELVQRVTALESVLPKAAEPAPAEPATAEAAPADEQKEQRIEKLTDEAMNTIQKMIIRVQGIERGNVKGIIESKLKTIETFLQESATRQIGMISRDTLGEITPNYAANSDIGRQIVIASAATATVINTIYAEDTTFNKFQNIGYQDLQQRMNDAQVLLTKDRIPNTTMSTSIFDVPPELTAEHNLPPEKKPILVVQEFKRKDGSNVKAYYLTTRSILESDARISPVASPAATAEAPAATPAETVKPAEKEKPLEGNVFVAPLVRIIPDVHGGKDINTLTNPKNQPKIESPLSDMLKGMQEGEVAVFVGDLFDRGGQSWRSAQEAMEMTMQGKAIYNFGNHEALFMGAMVTDTSGKNGDFEAFKTWIFNGGDEMAESALVDMTEYNAALEKVAKASGISRDAAKQVLLRSKDPALANLHAQIKQNENLKTLHGFLTQHGKMFTIIDNVLVTHAGVLADKNTGELLDVNINGTDYGKGLVAFQKMESVLKGTDEEEKSKLILWLANHGGSPKTNAQNPLWVREDNFQEVVQDRTKAHVLREKLNEQAQAMGTKIELTVVGHTPSMGDTTAATQPLRPDDKTPRFLFADTGYYEGMEPRAVLLRVNAATPDKVTALYVNPSTDPATRVHGNSGANILEQQYDFTRGSAPEIGGAPKKAAPVVEDAAKEILKEPTPTFKSFGGKSEGGSDLNPASLVFNAKIDIAEKDFFTSEEIPEMAAVFTILEKMKKEGEIGELAVLTDNLKPYPGSVNEFANWYITTRILKAVTEKENVNEEFLKTLLVDTDMALKSRSEETNKTATEENNKINLNADIVVAFTDARGQTFIASVGQARVYKLDTEGKVHLVARETREDGPGDESRAVGGENFTEDEVQIVSGEKANLKPGEQLIIVNEGIRNRQVPDEIKEKISQKYAYTRGSNEEENANAKQEGEVHVEEEIFETVFLGGKKPANGEETINTLINPPDKENVYNYPVAAIVLENTTPPPITPENVPEGNINLEPGPVPDETQFEFPLTGNPEIDAKNRAFFEKQNARIERLERENQQLKQENEQLKLENQQLKEENLKLKQEKQQQEEKDKAAIMELAKDSKNMSKARRKQLKDDFGIDLKDEKTWKAKPLPALLIALMTVGILSAAIATGTGVLAHK